MMRNALAVRFLALMRVALFLCATLFFFSSPQSGNVSAAFANDTQCTIPQNQCGCATCGCGGGGFGLPSCPAGQVLYDDYCLPACPSGYSRYPGIPGLCIPPCDHGCPEAYDQVPLPECPQGYHRDLRNPDQCAADPTGYGDNCPLGMSYSFETGKCEASCPRGFYLNGNGLCESYYARACPKDYTRDSETGKCEPPGTWPLGYRWVCLPHCPEGTYRDIREPTRCIPPPPSCPQGYDNVQGRCLPVCDKGVQRDTYGYCTPPRCPEGTFQTLRGQCIPIGCPQGTETYKGQCMPICDQGLQRDQNGRCIPPPPPPVKQCPQGQRFNPNSQNCERIPPNQPNCPDNTSFNLRTKKCEPNRIPDCKIGLHHNANGECVPDQLRVPNCKRGTQLDDNGRCVPVRVFVPRGCPDGTFLDRRSRRCIPFDSGNNNPDQPPPDVPPNIRLPNLNPGLLRQFIPQNNGGGQLPTRGFNQSDCPDGMFRDKIGRCVGQ